MFPLTWHARHAADHVCHVHCILLMCHINELDTRGGEKIKRIDECRTDDTKDLLHIVSRQGLYERLRGSALDRSGEGPLKEQYSLLA